MDRTLRMAKARAIIAAAVLATAAGGAITLNWLRKYDAPQLIGEYYQRIPTGNKMIALTFDDGPDPRYTAELLKILTRYGSRATFFVIGSRVALYPDIVREIYGQGSQVGNHSWDHPRLIFRAPGFIRDQIERTDEAIRRTGYSERIDFRAPHGNKLLVLPYVLKSMDKRHILFGVVPVDWKAATADELFRRIDRGIMDGCIVLLHDGGGDREQTLGAVRMILDKYTKDGWRFVTVAEMIENR